jgi:hypothetical protein
MTKGSLRISFPILGGFDAVHEYVANGMLTESILALHIDNLKQSMN